MKKYLVLLILPLIFMATAGKSQAQYNNAIGLRLGPAWGITFKHKMNDAAGLEFLLNNHWGGWTITGMYEHHFPIITDGMNFYIGGGAHLGFYNYNSRYDKYWDNYGGGAYLGLDLILGLEYTLPSAPLNFSLDYKPAFDFVGHSGFWGDGGALSIRYTF